MIWHGAGGVWLHVTAQLRDHAVSLYRSIYRALALLFVIVALAGLAVQQPTAATYVVLGQSAAQHLDWRRALSDFQVAAARDPSASAPYIGMAQIWYWQHKLPAASQAIKRVTQRASAPPSAWLLAGQIAALAGDTTSALTDWHRALYLAPRTKVGTSAATLAVDTLLDQGSVDQALSIITSLPVLTSHLQWDEVLAWLHRGRASQAQALMATLPATAQQSSYHAIATQWHGTARDEGGLGLCRHYQRQARFGHHTVTRCYRRR